MVKRKKKKEKVKKKRKKEKMASLNIAINAKKSKSSSNLMAYGTTSNLAYQPKYNLLKVFYLFIFILFFCQYL